MNSFKVIFRQNYLLWSMAFLFSIILFPRNLKPIAVAFFAITVIVKAVKEKSNFHWRYFLINAGYYVFILLSLWYSDDLKSASLKLQTMSSLFIFPLLFSLLQKKDYEKIYAKKAFFFYIYILTVLIFCTVVFLWYAIVHFGFYDTTKHFSILVEQKLHKFSIHPIYLSINLGISIIFCCYLFMKRKSIHLILLGLLLFFFLIILSKKGPILSLILVSFYTLFFALDRKYLRKGVLLIGITILVLFSIPKVNNNFKEFFKIEQLTNENTSSTNVRYAIYKSAIKPMKESVLFGYGIGDFNNVLIESYTNDILIKARYNSHNQYISFVLIGGVFLLLLFLFSQGYNIYLASKFNNYLFVMVILFFLLNMFTESILERENGVIMFSFLSCFFGYKNYIST